MSKNMSECEVLGSGKWLELKKVGKWEWVRRVNASGVVGIYAFTDADEVVLVEQPRAPLGEHARVLEIPAGLAGDIKGKEDEAMAQAAQRELEEETGYRAGDLREILESPSSPGMSEETIHLYLARKLTKVGPGGGDDSEDIEVHVVPMARFHEFVWERVRCGTWVDPRVLAVPFFHSL